MVIPARNAAASLERLLGSIPDDVAEVIVVDDGSTDATPKVAAAAGATVVDGGGRGPAAARNRGAGVVTTPLVLFLDADTVVDAAAIETLAAHMDDPHVGLVAPRIRPLRPPHTVVERYEAQWSPLDMGAAAGRVQPGTRLTLVPAAAMLVRTDVATFDESLRAGEDVDLCWRLDAARWEVRYDPSAVVRHEHRTSLTAMLARRLAYGRPYAQLERKYPGGFVACSVGRERPVDDARALGHAITTTWLPVSGLVALRSRRARWVLAALLVGRHRHRLAWLPLAVADDLAFAAGIWSGAIDAREWRVLGVARRPDRYP